MNRVTRIKGGALALSVWLLIVSLLLFTVCYFYSVSEIELLGLDFWVLFVTGMLFVLGPVLSVLVFKSNSLAYMNDLSVLFLVSMVIGLVTVYFLFASRPLYYVFAVDRIVLATADRIDFTGANPAFSSPVFGHEKLLVAAKEIESNETELIFSVLAGAPDIEYRAQRYFAIEHRRLQVIERATAQVWKDEETLALPLYVGREQVGYAFLSQGLKMRDLVPSIK